MVPVSLASFSRALHVATRMTLALGAGALTGLAVMAPRVVAEAPRLREIPRDSWPATELPDASRKDDAPPGDGPGLVRFDVTLYHIHTHELLPVSVDAPPRDEAVSRFLRCRVSGEMGSMDRRPLDVAIRLAREQSRRRVHVVSGFRSPKFNALLRKKGHEVAPSSYHMLGDALDFRIPGVPTRALVDALDDHPGGLGRYPESAFVHVDVGPRRRWRGR